MRLTYHYRHWTKTSVENDEKSLYIYGGNFEEYGTKGQSCIRGLKNTIELTTKINPELTKYSFLSDAYLQPYSKYIDVLFKKLEIISKKYENVYISPLIGLGMAKLNKKAPKCYKYLICKINEYIG